MLKNVTGYSKKEQGFIPVLLTAKLHSSTLYQSMGLWGKGDCGLFESLSKYSLSVRSAIILRHMRLALITEEEEEMIIDFKNVYKYFSLTTTWSRAQANHKGVEKYIFYCFGDECFPKWDFEKLTMLCQSRGASLYIPYRDLLASLQVRRLSSLHCIKHSYG